MTINLNWKAAERMEWPEDTAMVASQVLKQESQQKITETRNMG